MTDDQKTLHPGRSVPEKASNRLYRRIIEPFFRHDLDAGAESGRGKFPGFLGSNRRRYEYRIRDQSLRSHISADSRRVPAAPLDQRTGTIVHARFRANGFGVSKYEKTTHSLSTTGASNHIYCNSSMVSFRQHRAQV